MLNKLLICGLFLGLLAVSNSAEAQFGRFGPVGLRPPMPPIPPMPIPVPAGPGYLRVPGVGPVVPTIAVRPGYGYVRQTAVVIPVVVPTVTSAARVAVVQPIPSSLYSVGRFSYNAANPNPRPNPASPPSFQNPTSGSASNDLRPGMVLPDGAIVVSVGQSTVAANPLSSQPATNPSSQLQPATNLPTIAPEPSPTPTAVPGTQSILRPAEELPAPQSTTEPSSESANVPRKF